jgi:hypothetical protein
VLRLATSAAQIFFHERRVGECRLRISVQAFHVAVRRRVIEVEVALLDVFAVIAFVVGQAEEPFLEKRIPAVPEGEREADVLMSVAETGETVLVPAVGARSGVVVRKVFPGC